MKRQIVAAIVISSLVGIPIVVKYRGSKSGTEVEIAKVEKKEIHPSILASGNLAFRQEVQLSAEVIGRVSEVLAKEGDMIQKGQVLLRLDPSTYKSDVAQQEAAVRNSMVAIDRAQLNVANQKLNLDRVRRLAESKFVDVSRLDDAMHQMDLTLIELRSSREINQQNQALLIAARERLAKTEVRAPISGTVVAMQIKVGETAVASATGIAGSSLLTIADVAGIVADVYVDEADVARVFPGMRANIFPAALSDRPLSGKIESIALAPRTMNVLNGQTNQGRSYVVKVRLEEKGDSLRTGMTCRVEILGGDSVRKPVVPVQAVLASDSMNNEGRHPNYVFVIRNGVAKKIAVEIGIADDVNQEISSGLALGDEVVTGPARTLQSLRDGEPVKVYAPTGKLPLAVAQGPAP